MKTRIVATASTTYQLNSLNSFGMGFTKNMGGSFSASQEFDTLLEACQYLTERAEKYNDEDPCGTPARLRDMLRDIKRDCLTLDAVTAHIVRIKEEE